MSSHSQSAVADLRQSIDNLPAGTRTAMLRGVTENTVIAGDFASSDGGICPMVAAHRSGGKANALGFADAWDMFTGVYGRQICRPATTQEVDVLIGELRASLGLAPLRCAHDQLCDHLHARWERSRAQARGEILAAPSWQTGHAPLPITPTRVRQSSGSPLDLAAAISEHQDLVKRRQRREKHYTGTPLDLAAAISDHQSIARSRRGREAATTSMDWLLPADIIQAPQPFVEELDVDFGELDFGVDAEFDFELS